MATCRSRTSTSTSMTQASPRRRGFTRPSSSERPKRAGASTSARSAARCCGRRSTQSATSWRACHRPWDASVAVDGYSRPYVTAVSYASACYGLLALLASVAIVRRLGRWWPGLADVGGALGAGRVAGHASAVLHVHRAADVARDVGLRRGRVHSRVADRPRHVEHRRDGRARSARRRDGHGARAGRVLRRGPGNRLRLVAAPRRWPGSIAPARRRSGGRGSLRADVHAAGAGLPRAQRPHRPVAPRGTEDVLVFAPRDPGRRLAVARLPHVDAVGGHRVRGVARSAAPSAG